ncbi:TRAP transporter small permease subunit [Nitrosomonas marina]|uniref:TRAP transporter small permease protein n=1 Tax=Nitrosomonas marina TaxID=917 RepID=A0A1H8ACI0_9PROT|nr:TRAP transporter small permease subunit [Nitrosomonas marina]SEM68572.1 TRAP-type mannitol/chloroaromatic compound transport system, small permease component [Nitrosomonas marina]
MQKLRQLELYIGRISGLFGWLAGWLCILMIAVVFVDVIARYAFESGSIAMQELEWHLFAAVFLLGAAYTMRENANVRVDVLYEKLSIRRKAAIDLFGTVFFVIPMSTLILYSSFDFVAYSYETQEVSNDPGGLHYRFTFKALLPFGYFLVLVQAIAVISQNIRLLAGDSLDPGQSTPGHRKKS